MESEDLLTRGLQSPFEYGNKNPHQTHGNSNLTNVAEKRTPPNQGIRPLQDIQYLRAGATKSGRGHEFQIGGSDQVPAISLEHLTATDIKKLKDELRILKKRVYEQEKACFICTSSFANIDVEGIADHYREHQNTIQNAGNCLLCGDRSWAFMSTDERLGHLLVHEDRVGIWFGHQRLEELECPGCDKVLSTFIDTEMMLEHVISHDPFTVKFCDRCARSYSQLSDEELRYHRHICIEGPERDTKWEFCQFCGTNVTLLDAEDTSLHNSDCKEDEGFIACTQCGWDMTVMSDQEARAHAAFCKPPGGTKETYCKRCGEKKGGSDPNAHKDCRSTRFKRISDFAQLQRRETGEF